jgi:hypothetical protein
LDALAGFQVKILVKEAHGVGLGYAGLELVEQTQGVVFELDDLERSVRYYLGLSLHIKVWLIEALRILVVSPLVIHNYLDVVELILLLNLLVSHEEDIGLAHSFDDLNELALEIQNAVLGNRVRVVHNSVELQRDWQLEEESKQRHRGALNEDDALVLETPYYDKLVVDA